MWLQTLGADYETWYLRNIEDLELQLKSVGVLSFEKQTSITLHSYAPKLQSHLSVDTDPQYNLCHLRLVAWGRKTPHTGRTVYTRELGAFSFN